MDTTTITTRTTRTIIRWNLTTTTFAPRHSISSPTATARTTLCVLLPQQSPQQQPAAPSAAARQHPRPLPWIFQTTSLGTRAMNISSALSPLLAAEALSRRPRPPGSRRRPLLPPPRRPWHAEEPARAVTGVLSSSVRVVMSQVRRCGATLGDSFRCATPVASAGKSTVLSAQSASTYRANKNATRRLARVVIHFFRRRLSGAPGP
jgi:hypothetical protein